MTESDDPDRRNVLDELTRRRLMYTGTAGAAALAGCSGSGNGGGGGGTTTTSTPTPTEVPTTVKSVTLKAASWGDEQEQKIVKNILNEYEKNHSNVTIKYQNTPFEQYSKKIQTQFAGNKAPDVFYLILDDAPKFMRNGALLNLNPYVKNAENYNLDGIYDEMLKAFTYNGKIYGIPKDISSVGFYHNMDHIKKAGASKPKTWDGIRKAAEAIKNSNSVDVTYPVAFNSQPRNTLVQLIWQNGGRVLSKDMKKCKLGEKPAIEALKFLNSLVEDDLAGLLGSDISGTWGAPALGKEQTSMMMSGAWTIGTLKSDHKSVYEAMEINMPKPKGGKKVTIVFTTAWAANANTESPTDAANLVKRLTSKEGMWDWVSTGNALPARGSLLKKDFYNDRPLLSSLGELGKVGRPFVFGPKSSQVLSKMQTNVEAVLTGGKKPAAAMKDAQSQINSIL